MTIKAFLRENRDELDRYILGKINRESLPRPLSDAERYRWILNDETLYKWALRNGVRV